MPIHPTESDDNSNHNSNTTTTRNSEATNTTTTTRIRNVFQGAFNFIFTTLAITLQVCHLLGAIFYKALTCSIPTRPLYIISISLLCIHQIVQKIIEYMPHVWFMVFDLIGHANLPERLQNLTPSSSIHMTEIDILEEIMESLIDHTFANSKTSSSIIVNDDHDSLLAQFKKPLLSIMIPTTILSIFIVITTTTFLLLHMTFQAAFYACNRYFSNENENNNDNDTELDGGMRSTTTSFLSSTSSPILLWGILSILILETVLPWICLCFGLYLSISVGGLTWCIFISSMILISTAVLRYLRSRVYIGFQEGFNHT